MRVFFIVLVFVKPGGVELVSLETPYWSEQSCIDASGPKFAAARKRSARARGALCYTVDELSRGK